MNIIKSILNNKNKEINLSTLPSGGYFYNDDFKIWIKPASEESIIEYGLGFNQLDVLDSIFRIKKIVRENTILSKGYDYRWIRNIDIIFIFIKIVEISKGESVWVRFYNPDKNRISRIKFSDKNLDRFDLSGYMNFYSKEEKCFIVNGWKYRLPSIGVEESLSNFLTRKIKNIDYYNGKDYNFIYFLPNKPELENGEIDNLIQLFNYDISEEDFQEMKSVYDKFQKISKIKLLSKDGFSIPISNVDFENIFIKTKK